MRDEPEGWPLAHSRSPLGFEDNRLLTARIGQVESHLAVVAWQRDDVERRNDHSAPQRCDGSGCRSSTTHDCTEAPSLRAACR